MKLKRKGCLLLVSIAKKSAHILSILMSIENIEINESFIGLFMISCIQILMYNWLLIGIKLLELKKIKLK